MRLAPVAYFIVFRELYPGPTIGINIPHIITLSAERDFYRNLSIIFPVA